METTPGGVLDLCTDNNKELVTKCNNEMSDYVLRNMYDWCLRRTVVIVQISMEKISILQAVKTSLYAKKNVQSHKRLKRLLNFLNEAECVIIPNSSFHGQLFWMCTPITGHRRRCLGTTVGCNGYGLSWVSWRLAQWCSILRTNSWDNVRYVDA